jgi:hypothetical protein
VFEACVWKCNMWFGNRDIGGERVESFMEELLGRRADDLVVALFGVCVAGDLFSARSEFFCWPAGWMECAGAWKARFGKILTFGRNSPQVCGCLCSGYMSVDQQVERM